MVFSGVVGSFLHQIPQQTTDKCCKEALVVLFVICGHRDLAALVLEWMWPFAWAVVFAVRWRLGAAQKFGNWDQALTK